MRFEPVKTTGSPICAVVQSRYMESVDMPTQPWEALRTPKLPRRRSSALPIAGSGVDGEHSVAAPTFQ